MYFKVAADVKEYCDVIFVIKQQTATNREINRKKERKKERKTGTETINLKKIKKKKTKNVERKRKEAKVRRS